MEGLPAEPLTAMVNRRSYQHRHQLQASDSLYLELVSTTNHQQALIHRSNPARRISNPCTQFLSAFMPFFKVPRPGDTHLTNPYLTSISPAVDAKTRQRSSARNHYQVEQLNSSIEGLLRGPDFAVPDEEDGDGVEYQFWLMPSFLLLGCVVAAGVEIVYSQRPALPLSLTIATALLILPFTIHETATIFHWLHDTLQSTLCIFTSIIAAIPFSIISALHKRNDLDCYHVGALAFATALTPLTTPSTANNSLLCLCRDMTIFWLLMLFKPRYRFTYTVIRLLFLALWLLDFLGVGPLFTLSPTVSSSSAVETRGAAPRSDVVMGGNLPLVAYMASSFMDDVYKSHFENPTFSIGRYAADGPASDTAEPTRRSQLHADISDFHSLRSVRMAQQAEDISRISANIAVKNEHLITTVTSNPAGHDAYGKSDYQAVDSSNGPHNGHQPYYREWQTVSEIVTITNTRLVLTPITHLAAEILTTDMATSDVEGHNFEDRQMVSGSAPVSAKRRTKLDGADDEVATLTNELQEDLTAHSSYPSDPDITFPASSASPSIPISYQEHIAENHPANQAAAADHLADPHQTLQTSQEQVPAQQQEHTTRWRSTNPDMPLTQACRELRDECTIALELRAEHTCLGLLERWCGLVLWKEVVEEVGVSG